MKDAITIRAILLCAGSGSRTGLNYNKALHFFGSKTILERTLDSLFECGIFSSVMVAASEGDYEKVKEIASLYENTDVCVGGKTRSESSRKALLSVSPCDVVVIHDGARPFCPPEVFSAAAESAAKYGSGIAAVPVTDTVKRVTKDGDVLSTLDRDELYSVQTPQAFRYNKIISAYEKVNESCTDDSAVYEKAGFTARIVEGSPFNRKITSPADLFFTESENLKIGIGFDVHPLKEGRKLIIGGVDIPHAKGLYGHSDADVLAHAITDGILSAAGLCDIGVLFPDDDPKTLGADSLMLMREAVKKAEEKGFAVNTVSAAVIAEKPKLAPHIPTMRQNIAKACNALSENINVSATTAEHLGMIGEERGIAASATVTLIKKNR